MQISEKCKKTIELVEDQIRNARSRNEYYETEPGNILLKNYPDILKELSQDIRCLVVTGTNGKTTTCRMLSSIFREAGIDFLANPEGANMTNRIATIFCDNYLAGKNRKDVAILECDEGYLDRLLPKIETTCLVVTNIFPDQLFRFSSEEYVANFMCEAMKNSPPSVCIISKSCHFRERIMAVPKWKFIVFDDENDTDELPELQIPGSFNIKNALAAKTAAQFWGIDDSCINAGLKNTRPAFGRFETIKTDKGTVTVCLAKNPYGTRVIKEWVINEKHAPFARLILAVNNNEGDDEDPGWVRLCDYSGLETMFDPIYVTGNCSDVVAEQVRLAGGDPEVISIDDIPKLAMRDDGDTLVVANYTAMMMTRKQFVDIGYTAEYWNTCFKKNNLTK